MPLQLQLGRLSGRGRAYSYQAPVTFDCSMSTPEERAAERQAAREKRQARIRASGTDRLAKITGAAGSRDFKPPPSMDPPRSTATTAVPPTATPPLAPPGQLSEKDTDSMLQDPLLEFLRNSQANAGSGNAEMDPLLALLAGAGNANAAAAADPQRPMDPQRAQHFANAQARSTQRANFEFTWDLLHFVLSIGLGLYAALGNPWLVCKVFASLELAFTLAKLVLGHQTSGLPAAAMLGPVISMLPPTRQRQVNTVGAVINAARIAYRDMAIVLFVYGTCSLGGHDFARME